MDLVNESPINHYHVLNVPPSASRVEIREAYLRLKNTYAAGSAALYSLISEDEASGQLQRVEEAFRILGDEVSRREFDRALFGPGDDRRAGASQSDRAQLDLPTERLLHARDFLAGGWQSEPIGGAGMARAGLGGSGLPGSSLSASGVGGIGGGEVGPIDPSVVRTTRSTLPIIKLRVNATDNSELHVRYAELIAASDPADGDLFRRLRELADVSEDEMQERIKVSIGYLRAIEGNRFERLPQAVYVKGFLRGYFRYLDVPDAERLVAAFASRLTDWQSHKKT